MTLKFTGEGDEVILEILMSKEAPGSPAAYYARISEGATGSESDISGDSPAELVEGAFQWAGISGFNAELSSSIAELQELITAAASSAEFDLEVRLFTRSSAEL